MSTTHAGSTQIQRPVFRCFKSSAFLTGFEATWFIVPFVRKPIALKQIKHAFPHLTTRTSFILLWNKKYMASAPMAPAPMAPRILYVESGSHVLARTSCPLRWSQYLLLFICHAQMLNLYLKCQLHKTFLCCTTPCHTLFLHKTYACTDHFWLLTGKWVLQTTQTLSTSIGFKSHQLVKSHINPMAARFGRKSHQREKVSHINMLELQWNSCRHLQPNESKSHHYVRTTMAQLQKQDASKGIIIIGRKRTHTSIKFSMAQRQWHSFNRYDLNLPLVPTACYTTPLHKPLVPKELLHTSHQRTSSHKPVCTPS